MADRDRAQAAVEAAREGGSSDAVPWVSEGGQAMLDQVRAAVSA